MASTFLFNVKTGRHKGRHTIGGRYAGQQRVSGSLTNISYIFLAVYSTVIIVGISLLIGFLILSAGLVHLCRYNLINLTIIIVGYTLCLLYKTKINRKSKCDEI